MIFLLYKPIIGLSPSFAPVSGAGCILSVALTAQGNTSTECLNRIYCLASLARFSSGQIQSVQFRFRFLPGLALLAIPSTDPPRLYSTRFTMFHVNKS
jgi:hypothetical protein